MVNLRGRVVQLARNGVVVVPLGLLIAGCATSTSGIQTTYVSPVLYNRLTCEEIEQERVRVEETVTRVGGQIDNKAANDAGLTAMGLTVFWPALFFLGGSAQQEAQFAHAKGEYDALMMASARNECHLPPGERGVVRKNLPAVPVRYGDLTTMPVPSGIAGNQLRVRSRTLSIGPGHWFLVNRKAGAVAGRQSPNPATNYESQPRAQTLIVTALRATVDGEVAAILRVETAIDPTPYHYWNVDACNPRPLYRNLYGSNRDRPPRQNTCRPDRTRAVRLVH